MYHPHRNKSLGRPSRHLPPSLLTVLPHSNPRMQSLSVVKVKKDARSPKPSDWQTRRKFRAGLGLNAMRCWQPFIALHLSVPSKVRQTSDVWLACHNTPSEKGSYHENPYPPKFGGWRFTPQIWGANLQKTLVLQCFLALAR